MSREKESNPGHDALLRDLAAAGRTMSDAAVMYHTALAEKLGLGASDWKTLGLLEQYGAVTAGELAELSGLAPASVTGLLDRLESGGFVRRRQDPADRRRVVVEMKADALAGERAVFEGLTRRLKELYERYEDEELAMLLEFMLEIARRQKDATAEIADR